MNSPATKPNTSPDVTFISHRQSRRRPVSPASPAQRDKVYDRQCVNCGAGPGCDPAHLCPRSQGGCDDPACVVPLCRGCHTAFDQGMIDLEPVLALPQFSVERSHMASHMSLRRCIQRLNGRRTA